MSYREDAAQAAAEIAREYYEEEAPNKGAPAIFPTVPDTEDSNYAVFDPEDIPFQYIELEIPGEGTFLAILTKIAVKNGPGLKFRAELAPPGHGR
jgi:hypothetical protein